MGVLDLFQTMPSSIDVFFHGWRLPFFKIFNIHLNFDLKMSESKFCSYIVISGCLSHLPLRLSAMELEVVFQIVCTPFALDKHKFRWPVVLRVL